MSDVPTVLVTVWSLGGEVLCQVRVPQEREREMPAFSGGTAHILHEAAQLSMEQVRKNISRWRRMNKKTQT